VASPWPPSSSQGPRRRLDARWLTVIVIAIIIVVVLVRQHRIHISEFEILYFLAVIPSVIVHEVTHGWVALSFGDDTAKRAHRLTLNPLAHVSIVGTIIVPAVLVLSGYPAFGWAKPVPVNVSRLRHSRNSAVVVALAGPLVNIILAVAFGLIFFIAVSPATKGAVFAYDYAGITLTQNPPLWVQYLFFLGYVNVILAVFNLVPLPPLDGSSVIDRMLPQQWLPGYLSIRPYTIFLPFLLLWLRPQWLADIFSPFIQLWGHLLGTGILSGSLVRL
jgi:Zn-dependent protease